MALKVLFSKFDVINVIESQKQRLKDAYLRLPEDQALDEEVIGRLKSEYMLNIPILKTDEMYCVEGKTCIDVSRMPNRIAFGSGPIMEEVTELTVHIPFEGDPGVFNIAPSAYNSRVAEGDVVGNEVLLRVVAIDGKYDIQAHIDREVAQINWALTHLREKKAYENQELESALRHAVAQRKRAIESRGYIVSGLRIPVRQPSPSSAKSVAAPLVSSRSEQKISPSSTANRPPQWDVFISHASEDKAYVQPLVEALQAAGITVWYDQVVLEWGDDLRKKIDHGLANCRYGIVVFSKAFLGGKKWTEHEFNGLFALEKHGTKLILPIWHGISHEELLSFSPAFASRLAKDSSTDSYVDIRDSLLRMLKRPVPEKTGQPESGKAALEGETIAYVIYYAPNADRPMMHVRKSSSHEDWFRLHHVDGTVEEGTRRDIAVKYVLADKKLTMDGYKRQNISGGSVYPEFNL